MISERRSSYSMIKQRGKCSCKYSKSSWDAPGQFVSSNSCKWRNWIILDSPLDVNNGQPILKNEIQRERNEMFVFQTIGCILRGIVLLINWKEQIDIEQRECLRGGGWVGQRTDLLATKSVDFALNTNVAIQSLAPASTNARIAWSARASSKCIQRQYQWYEYIYCWDKYK